MVLAINLGFEGCLRHMSTRWKALEVNFQMDQEHTLRFIWSHPEFTEKRPDLPVKG
jgi:hypothetical protein